MTDVDVLVIGGGPSGLTVAAEVVRTGASILVLERREVEPMPALIVRPDTYVAWVTTSTPGPGEVSAELARILSIGSP